MFPQDEMAEWIDGASMRLVTTFSPETSSAIFGGKIKVHMLYMSDSSSSSHEGQMEALTKVRDDAKIHDNPSSLVLAIRAPPWFEGCRSRAAP